METPTMYVMPSESDMAAVRVFMERREDAVLNYIVREVEKNPAFDTTKLKRYSVETFVVAREFKWKSGSKLDTNRARAALEGLRKRGDVVIVHSESEPFKRTYYVTNGFISVLRRLRGEVGGQMRRKPA